MSSCSVLDHRRSRKRRAWLAGATSTASATMQPRSFLTTFAGIAALASLAACLNTPTGQSTQPSDYAVVDGSVTETGSSTPILGALVGVRLPTNRTPAAYIAPTANSTDAGTFQIGVYRVDSTVARGIPDTMTVWVIGTLPGLPAQGHTDSVQTTLRFSPTTSTATPSNVSLQLSY